MKYFFIFRIEISLLTACSNDDDFKATNQDTLFSWTSENALKICVGKSRILENENEVFIKIEIKDANNEGDKNVKFKAVETYKKGGKYRIVSCLQNRNHKIQLLKRLKQIINLILN